MSDIIEEVKQIETAVEEPKAESEVKIDETKPEVKAQETVLTSKEVEYKDFKVPEGFVLDDKVLEKISPIFKEANLSKDVAQKMLDAHMEIVQGLQTKQAEMFEQKQAEIFEQTKTDWLNKVKADKEVGGSNFDESIKTAKLGLTKFASPELIEFLNESGIGNNLEMVKLFNKLGKLTKEDVPGKQGSPSVSRGDIVDRLYPSKGE